MDKETQASLALEEAAKAARDAFYKCQKIEHHRWEEIAEDSRNAWRAVATAVRKTYP